MNPRLRRLAADFEQIRTAFAGHRYIKVEAIEGNPPEKYRVTYFVKGVKAIDGDLKPILSEKHIAYIYLHADYPREKPKCVLETPIYHPNFGSYICIGDSWGAGETLVDVIVQIGDMIQYQSYNPKSPLNANAARWAVDHKNFFPVGNIDLYQPEPEVVLDLPAETDDLGIELHPSKKPEPEPSDDLDIKLG